MSEREGTASRREAAAPVAGDARDDGGRHRTALARYLAAIGGRGTNADASTAAAGTPGSDALPSPTASSSWTDATVGDVMTRTVITVDADATFKEITRTLTDNRVSAVPVVDAGRHVLGVVSASDLLAKVAAAGDPHAKVGGYLERGQLRRKAQGETARELMTSPALTVSPADPVVEAARLAARSHVRRLPVVDAHGVVVGIVTRSDLLRVFLGDDEQIHDYITDVILTERYLLQPGSVTVEVADGVVTLRGRLETRLMLDPLLQDVRSVAGVVAVHNELSYDAEYPTTTPMDYPFP